MLQKHFNLQEKSIDEWPFWMFEENIKLINEIIEEEKEAREEQEKGQNSGNNQFSNMNPDSIMKSAQEMTRNLPKFN